MRSHISTQDFMKGIDVALQLALNENMHLSAPHISILSSYVSSYLFNYLACYSLTFVSFVSFYQS